MTKRSGRALIALCAIGLSTDAVIRGQSTNGVRSAEVQTIGVPGASNSTPSLAAAGQIVAVVWTAAKDGRSNVYIAMSGDGGATFSAPTRVNDQDGDAGATNEQPPRVVISASGRQRAVTVLWSKRDTGSTRTRTDIIRMARSTDGGRTFSPARITHESAFTGARGWQSFTVAPDGSLHAVWLDGLHAEQKIADDYFPILRIDGDKLTEVMPEEARKKYGDLQRQLNAENPEGGGRRGPALPVFYTVEVDRMREQEKSQMQRAEANKAKK